MLLSLIVAACQPSSAVALGRSPAGLEQVSLIVTTAAGAEHRFVVEVARSDEEQRVGLMNRPTLAPNRGMIFPYDPPQSVSFWMRDTLIPLDIIFVRRDGVIARIAANTPPLSLDPVPSGEPIATVFEIGGGRAAALGLAPGDRVRW